MTSAPLRRLRKWHRLVSDSFGRAQVLQAIGILSPL